MNGNWENEKVDLIYEDISNDDIFSAIGMLSSFDDFIESCEKIEWEL